jgi:hypothetical protein
MGHNPARKKIGKPVNLCKKSPLNERKLVENETFNTWVREYLR